MLLLSVESSAVTASAALTDGNRVIKSELINNGLTHSETLLPLIERVMQGYSYSELDAVAVSAGPGSLRSTYRRCNSKRYCVSKQSALYKRITA